MSDADRIAELEEMVSNLESVSNEKTRALFLMSERLQAARTEELKVPGLLREVSNLGEELRVKKATIEKYRSLVKAARAILEDADAVLGNAISIRKGDVINLRESAENLGDALDALKDIPEDGDDDDDWGDGPWEDE